ncbi:MAG: DNA (cytosine-5-)-methyltransferase [candidate division Zixibacteria bacterium]|nr:DNA (cytosine-5-)-methyltransferase [candidate division Zixibacteria bacterium]
MIKQILIRNIPQQVRRRIDKVQKIRPVSQQEILIDVLKNTSKKQQLSLFKDNTENGIKPIPFKFIELFAGIGGFRIGLERIGGKCAYSNEWDKHAQRTYEAWFGDTPEGDITKVDPSKIPDHDILTAGFPCQPFSIAGVSKKKSLGLDHGFKDQTQGTLFFNLATIIEKKRPPIFILENVKNLTSHDKGKTWHVIKSILDGLNYRIFDKVIDASAYVPQHRERIILVGFDRNVFGNNPPFEFPLEPLITPPVLKTILESKPEKKYTLSDHLWKYLQNYAERHRKKGNGFGYGIANLDGITRTLSARYFKDGSEILINQGKNTNPRRLTPREAARLMGFPDDLAIVVSDTQAYRQFGNAIVPYVVEAVGRQIEKVMRWHIINNGNGCLIKNRK